MIIINNALNDHYVIKSGVTFTRIKGRPKNVEAKHRSYAEKFVKIVQKLALNVLKLELKKLKNNTVHIFKFLF